MNNLPYTIIVGLEVHVELETETKMFCACKNDPFFAEHPNLHVCPVCMGLPGALPVPNAEGIKKTLMVGLGLGSTIPKRAKFDRKHYFYPDSPKGYQISQFDLPFCVGGALEVPASDDEESFVVRFERAHLEEDAGKLLHAGNGVSHVDLNRAGVPLLEMVTKPDIRSAAQARRFLQELQLFVRALGVSQADMEKGHMRCDVNINIKFEQNGETVKTPITEVKNVNSTRAVEKSIITESKRQYDEWLSGGEITTRQNKITVGWDETNERVNIQRAKEAANDYRYMPEPDIPPIAVYEVDYLNPEMIMATLPALPRQTRAEWGAAGVGSQDIETLLVSPERVAYVRSLAGEGVALKTAVNWLVNAAQVANLSTANAAQLIAAVEAKKASFSAVKAALSDLIEEWVKNPTATAESVLKATGLLQEHDSAFVEGIINKVVTNNPQVVAEFLAGNERVFGFLVGQVMKQAAGKAQPAEVSAMLQQKLRNTP